MFVTDITQAYVPGWTGKILRQIEDTSKIKVDDQFFTILGEDDELEQKCKNIEKFFVYKLHKLNL